MSEAELANAAWWAWLWGVIEQGAFAAVVIALAVEFVALKVGEPYKEKITHERDLQLARAQKDAADSKIALEKFKAPRELTPEQRGRIVDKLKKFSGTEYDIAISDSEPEILGLVLAVELVLSTAGWTELDWKGTGQALIRGGKQPLIRLGVTIANVLIVVLTDQPPKFFELALALSDALKAEGVDATAGEFGSHAMSSTNANAIHLLIGRKQ
jgi:hypothetical protein